MDTRDKMTREISKTVSFAINGLSELLTLQMLVFMQLLKERKTNNLILYYLRQIVYHCT